MTRHIYQTTTLEKCYRAEENPYIGAGLGYPVNHIYSKYLNLSPGITQPTAGFLPPPFLY